MKNAFQDISFHGGHLKYKKKKRKEWKANIWITLPAEREGEGGKKKKSPVWDWHFGVVWIRQLDLQWHRPTCVCPCTPEPLKRGSQCFNDGHGVSTHTICTCLHEQSVHKCNVTVRRLHHIFPANYIMTQTALWKTIPGANVWLFYTKLIKAVWR